MTRPHVLVADDEPQMATIVAYALQTQGFDVSVAHDGLEAKALLSEHRFDAAVLDVMMPRMDGLALCRLIQRTTGIPVLLLTALSEHEHVVEGFETGADDYVAKPFHPRELALRVSALIRRRGAVASGPAPVLTAGDLRIDTNTYEVTVSGVLVPMSTTEFRLLAVLAARPGVIVTWQDLLREAWHVEEWTGGREMVKAAIYRLRQRLDDDPHNPRYIVTVRGVGYRLVSDSTPEEKCL
jgi:DNA-binding response OmpR family regulator